MEQQTTKHSVHPSFLNVIKQKQRIKERLLGIKNKIGVYSAKGGVGKTTTAINIAYTLKRMGYKVGLLDADIDCPNITLFLNMNQKMDISQFPLKPIERDGVLIASTAMIVDDEKKPIIWRGPLVAKMLGDFFENTAWGELDYLIIDLPPGTSDAPLSIMQLLDLKGFIIITTPQRISAINSKRSGLMVKRFNIAILGVIENMSGSEPSSFTEELAEDLDTKLLGSVRLDRLFKNMDIDGHIPVLVDEESYENFKKILNKIVMA